MIYNAGTLAISGNTVTGAGTNFTDATNLIRAGQTLVVLTSPPQIFQIATVNTSTSLTLTATASPAIAAGTRYAILITDSLSVDGLAQSIAQLISDYDESSAGWEAFAGTSANQNITVTINGAAVAIPSIGKLATRGANGAVPVNQGGTGADNATDARSNLGLAYGTTAGTVTQGNDSRLNTVNGKSGGAVNGGLKASTASPTTTPAAGTITNSDLVGSRFGSGLYAGVDFSLYSQVVQGGGSYGILQLSFGAAPAYWTYDQNGVAYGTAWQPRCDERLKDLDGPIPDPLGKMKRIRGQTWKWKIDGAFGIGFTAQDVQKIFPEAVVSGANIVLPDGSEIDGVLSPDTYGVAAALHHEAILALMDKNEAQQAEIAALKSDLEGLKKIVEQLIAQ